MALPLPAILRTTAVRLSALYLLLFAICAVVLVFFVLPSVLQGMGEQTGNAAYVLQLAAFAISIWALVELGFLRGTVGPNRYGPDPLGAERQY